MKLFLLNLLQALRHLRRHKGQTLIIVCIISFALTAFTFSVSALWFQTHQDSHLPDYKDIYRVQTICPTSFIPHNYNINDSIACDIRDHAPADAKVGMLQYIHATVKGTNDTIVHLSTQGVDAGFFEVMQYEFLCGGPGKQDGEVVLTDSMARMLYGSTDVVGAPLDVTLLNEGSRKKVCKISGVIKTNEESMFETTLGALMYHNVEPVVYDNTAYCPNYVQTFVRTQNSKATQKVLSQTLHRFSESRFNSENTAITLIPHRMAELVGKKGTFWKSAFYLTVFMLLSSLLLLSALFSYLALLNTAADSRWTDHRLRISLGGGVADTLRRLHAEVLPVFCGIGLLTLVLMELSFDTYFKDITMPKGQVMAWFLISFFGLMGMVMLLCLVPVALQSRRHRRALAGVPQGKISPLNYPLAVVQVAVSMLLLFLVWQGGRQIHHICHDAMGMDSKYVYKIISASQAENIHTREMAQEIANASPAIESCVCTNPVFGRGGSVGYGIPGFKENLSVIVLSDSAMHLFRIKPKLFNPSDKPFRWKPNQLLLSSNALRHYGVTPESPYLEFDGKKQEVIGTIDICTRSLHMEPEMMGYLPKMNSSMNSYIYFRTMPGQEKEAIAAVKEVIRKHGYGHLVDTDLIRISPFEDLIAQTYKQEQNYLYLYSILSLVGFGIAVFGMLTLIGADLQRQRRSMAIRRIFGAGFKDCLRHTLSTYLIITLTGSAIALSLGYWLMGMWLELYSDHISLEWIQAVALVAVTVALVCMLVTQRVYACFCESPTQVINS